MTSRARFATASSVLLLSSVLVVSGPPGTAADPQATFTQPGAIDLGGENNSYHTDEPITVQDAGAANPYPSQIAVPPPSGAIVDVDVALQFVDHTRPDDLDILLVGPHGESVVLMSDSGGSNALEGYVIEFDDEVEESLPDEDAL